MNTRWFSFVGFYLLLVAAQAASTNRYVCTTGASTIPYDTWAKAGTSLNTVVAYANTFNEGDTVYVSNGVYTLSAGISVGNTIVKNFSSTREDTTVNGAGLYTCFTLTHSNAVVDGLTITNGYSASYGGGISMSAAGGTVTNCTIALCRAVNGGAGVYMANTGTVLNCMIVSNTTTSGNGGGVYGTTLASRTIASTFLRNRAEFNGGGIYGGTVINCTLSYNTTVQALAGGWRQCGGGGACNSYVFDSTLSSNQAPNGGGYYVDSMSMLVSNCLIVGNSSTTTNANDGGGGIWIADWYSYFHEFVNCTIRGNSATNNGGGIGFQYTYLCTNKLRDCLLSGNSAGNRGGGVFGSGNRGQYTLWNCTIAGNTAADGGGIYYNQAPDRLTAYNTIVYFNSGGSSSNWGGTASYMAFTNSCTAPTNSLPGANNMAFDPRFMNAADGNFRLIKGSPCINTGTNDYSWMDGALDLGGHTRIVDGTVDMGPYEWFPMGTVFSIY